MDANMDFNIGNIPLIGYGFIGVTALALTYATMLDTESGSGSSAGTKEESYSETLLKNTPGMPAAAATMPAAAAVPVAEAMTEERLEKEEEPLEQEEQEQEKEKEKEEQRGGGRKRRTRMKKANAKRKHRKTKREKK